MSQQAIASKGITQDARVPYVPGVMHLRIAVCRSWENEVLQYNSFWQDQSYKQSIKVQLLKARDWTAHICRRLGSRKQRQLGGPCVVLCWLSFGIVIFVMLSDLAFFNQGGDNVEDTGKWTHTGVVDGVGGGTKDSGNSQRVRTFVAAGSVW